jgi:hypothetical protein
VLKKPTLIILLPIIFILCIFVYLIIPGTYPFHKLIFCKIRGGILLADYFTPGPQYFCKISTSDANKPCHDGQECQSGSCIPSQQCPATICEIVGKCAAYSGCYTFLLKNNSVMENRCPIQ